MITLPVPNFNDEITPMDVHDWAMELIQSDRSKTVDNYNAVHVAIKDRTRDHVVPVAKMMKKQKSKDPKPVSEKGLVVAPRKAIKASLFEITGHAKSTDFLRYLNKEQYAALTIVSWYIHLKIEEAARLHQYYKEYHNLIPRWCADVMSHLSIKKTAVLSELPSPQTIRKQIKEEA